MSIPVHRDTDSRACGAATISTQAKNVFVNNLLWSINGDPNSDGGGSLIAATNQVYIGGTMVVNVGDSSSPDSLCPIPGGPHCAPSATTGSSNVYVGG